ncbi:MAG: transcriptional regulator [Candidatus Methylomirabilota bacterium]|nr:transcriptional regulator [candidate division NC10 bacterium]PWB47881.1 MAG: transcriptional regulator [candidate division NC10 bacterium]
MELTRRQEIMAMLRDREWTLEELARNFVVSKKIIIDDLEHIARSVPRPARLLIHPPTCDACGYRFKDRARFSDPSRCPRCKNEHLLPQRFRIE